MHSSPQQTTAVRFGPFELDLKSSCLTRKGHQERLAIQPARLLVFLVQRRGELVTREELRSQLWPGATAGDFDHGLNNAVNRLREALGDSAASPRYIQTAPRRGYRFIADVERVAPALLDDAAASSSMPSMPSMRSMRGDRSAAQDAFAQDAKSIAVHPLRNTSGDASHNYLAEVLTEALMSELAQQHRFRVFPSLVAATPDPGSAPHIDLLVEGSVTRLADQIHIAVQVFQLPSRGQLWSQEYSRGLEQIFAVLKEVSAVIAVHLRTDLTPRGPLQLEPAPAVKPAAYDHYLRGRFYAQHQNNADNETAISAFEHAVLIDPTFASAHAELAQSYVWRSFLFAPHERQWQEKAFMSVEKALSLDPHLAVAYLARGRLLWTPANHFPHLKAIRDYRRAVSLSPNLDEARNQLALIYCHIGYFEDALHESQEAALQNPNNHLAIYRRAQTFAFQSKYEEALALLRTIPRTVNPALIGYQTAWVLFNLGKMDEAAALIDQLLAAYPEDDGALYLSMQAVLAAAAGEHALAERRIETAIQQGSGYGHFHHTAYHIAVASALMSKPEQVVTWLTFASADGFPCYPLFATDTSLATVRSHPLFQEFMTGLRQQWITYPSML